MILIKNAKAEDILLNLYWKWGGNQDTKEKILTILADRGNKDKKVGKVVQLYFGEVFYTKALAFPPLWPHVREHAKHTMYCSVFIMNN